MKHKLFTITALAASLALIFASCQQEAAEPQAPGEGILVEIPIALEQPGSAEADTKVDANLNTGVCTWTYGDQVAVYVSGSGANAYRNGTVNISNNTLAISVEPGQSLANYAVYPAGFQDPANYSGATPGVIYPATYSFTGHKDLSTGTYIMTPMMAATGTDVMYFYHVGGMLRLALSHVPDDADKLELTFVGMTNVCGTCTVTNPGTSTATTAITSGGGNVLTVTDFTQSATMYVNVPLPCGDYSSLTAIRVKVLDGSDNQLANVSKTATGWGTLKHGYARIVPVDFSVDALGSVKLSANTPVTLWKSQTIQRTAKALYGDGLPFADATMVWTTTDDAVATVNSSTGLVTAVGPGEATITVTATSVLDGSKVSDDYTVYVNAVTGLSVANSHKVGIGATKTITATLTNTNNGTPTSIPADLVVSWASSDDDYVTVASATTSPVRVNATTMSASVIVNGLAYGSSTITASITSYGALIDSDNTVFCEDDTSITLPGEEYKYKFRGKLLSPGILQDDYYEETHHYSLTGDLDGLASLLAAYGTAAGRTKHYFSWNFLTDKFTTTDGVITGTVYTDASSNNWRIPTQSEWDTIFNTDPISTIRLGTTPLGRGVAKIVVNLTGSALEGQGLTTSSIEAAKTDFNDGASISKTNYIAGILLIPDGATVICSRMQGNVGSSDDTWGTSASSSCITYEDLEILVAGGCVFLPAAGRYDGSKWKEGGAFFRYWSATEDTSNSDNAKALYITSSAVVKGFGTNNSNVKSNFFPVHLIHD